jgi:hypothetical protein
LPDFDTLGLGAITAWTVKASGEDIVFSLDDYIRKSMWQLHALVFLGRGGDGKTTIARSLAAKVAEIWQPTVNNARPFFLLTSEIDTLRAAERSMLPYTPIVFDEFSGNDNCGDAIVAPVKLIQISAASRTPSTSRAGTRTSSSPCCRQGCALQMPERRTPGASTSLTFDH